MKLSAILLFSVGLLAISEGILIVTPKLITALLGKIAFTVAVKLGAASLVLTPLALLAGKKKRSTENQQVAAESMDNLLEAINKIDTFGCFQKMVCQLNKKDKEMLTNEELEIVKLFPEEVDDLTESNSVFVYAAGIGSQGLDSNNCEKLYQKCPLGKKDLEELLQKSWDCGL